MRCQACRRLVKATNIRIGKDGMRVGPGCYAKQLQVEGDGRYLVREAAS